MSARRPRSAQRGSFLLSALVCLLILTMALANGMQLAMGGYRQLSRSVSDDTRQQRALGIEAQARACLDGTSAALTCDPGPARDCLDALRTDGVSIELSGAPPICALEIRID